MSRSAFDLGGLQHYCNGDDEDSVFSLAAPSALTSTFQHPQQHSVADDGKESVTLRLPLLELSPTVRNAIYQQAVNVKVYKAKHPPPPEAFEHDRRYNEMNDGDMFLTPSRSFKEDRVPSRRIMAPMFYPLTSRVEWGYETRSGPSTRPPILETSSQVREEGNLYVVGVCPGPCKTEIGRNVTSWIGLAALDFMHRYMRPAEHGARLCIGAVLNAEQAHGELWRDGRVRPPNTLLEGKKGEILRKVAIKEIMKNWKKDVPELVKRWERCGIKHAEL